ncbi:STAS/SEC14 domain-containing protein [Parapedobacter defluvii]|uniref:STAS/SEC14 domain-containing protein n=1 Tax=Parapedobacter defluvii TaxID=2045106 RepID=UPI003342D10E
MIDEIKELPDHVLGVKVTGEVTAADLKGVLLPGLQRLADSYGSIHYLLHLETEVENFTAGAWVQDMLAGIKHFTQWKKIAIVTPQRGVQKFTDAFSAVVPGEARGFGADRLDEAVAWVSDDRDNAIKKRQGWSFKHVALALAGLLIARRVLKKIRLR